MAKIPYSEFVEGLDAAAALDGTEPVVVLQGGVPVESTTQDIADLGGGGATVETTGTITGTDAVLVPCFPIPDTNAYSITGSVIFKCTDAGGGTVVVGDVYVRGYWFLAINNETIGDRYEDGSDDTDVSMSQSIIALEDVASGQLRISITPPSDTADATSEFSYKIRLSGFSL